MGLNGGIGPQTMINMDRGHYEIGGTRKHEQGERVGSARDRARDWGACRGKGRPAEKLLD